MEETAAMSGQQGDANMEPAERAGNRAWAGAKRLARAALVRGMLGSALALLSTTGCAVETEEPVAEAAQEVSGPSKDKDLRPVIFLSGAGANYLHWYGPSETIEAYPNPLFLAVSARRLSLFRDPVVSPVPVELMPGDPPAAGLGIGDPQQTQGQLVHIHQALYAALEAPEIGYRRARNTYDAEGKRTCNPEWKAQPRPTFFLFGPDWRKSVGENVKELRRYVSCVEAIHRKKPIFVGHSQGGVIVEAFARSFPEHVHATVAVAAPLLGAPKAIYSLATGKQFGSIGSSIQQELLNSFPGVHELMPSPLYASVTGGRMPLVAPGVGVDAASFYDAWFGWYRSADGAWHHLASPGEAVRRIAPLGDGRDAPRLSSEKGGKSHRHYVVARKVDTFGRPTMDTVVAVRAMSRATFESLPARDRAEIDKSGVCPDDVPSAPLPRPGRNGSDVVWCKILGDGDGTVPLSSACRGAAACRTLLGSSSSKLDATGGARIEVVDVGPWDAPRGSVPTTLAIVSDRHSFLMARPNFARELVQKHIMTEQDD